MSLSASFDNKKIINMDITTLDLYPKNQEESTKSAYK